MSLHINLYRDLKRNICSSGSKILIERDIRFILFKYRDFHWR